MSSSLRFRISPSEFGVLQAGGEITETLGAPGQGQWTATCRAGIETSVRIVDGAVRFTISPADMDRLACADVEGLYFATDDSPPFRYYIEKNFPCAHPHPPEAAAMDPQMGAFQPTPAFEARKRRNNCD